jgi:hypothetical protein
MATLSVQTSDLDGLEATYAAAAAGGDVFANDGHTIFHVKNGGSDVTVTIDSKRACNQGADHDSVTVVTGGEERFIGPFAKERFDNANGQCEVAYTGVTSVTVAAIKVV